MDPEGRLIELQRQQTYLNMNLRRAAESLGISVAEVRELGLRSPHLELLDRQGTYGPFQFVSVRRVRKRWLA